MSLPRDHLRLWSTCGLLLCASTRVVAQNVDTGVITTDESVLLEDPELAARSDGPHADEDTTSQEHPSVVIQPTYTSEGHMRLHSRFGLDLYHADPREETWEGTNLAIFETSVRRSANLRFAAGVRVRFHIASFVHDAPDAKAQRLQLDVSPTAAYVDTKLAEGAHLQLGYQSVHMGSFDLISAADVLSVADLRNGPATMPEAAEVAQLALRFDYAPTTSLSLRAIYVPFFTPHIVSIAEGDYAIFRRNQTQVASDIAMLGVAPSSLLENLSRTDRERLAEVGYAVFSPETDLRSQQGAIRLTAHGATGELSLSVATALEHVPAFYFTPEAIDAIREPRNREVAERLEMVSRPVQVHYGRFALLAVDASIDVSPLSIGVETAYMLNRTLYTLGSGAYPGTLALPDTTDVLQAGLRIEYVRGPELAAVIETFGVYALSEPKDPTRGWVGLEAGRYLAGLAAGGTWTPGFGLRGDLAVLALTGFTWVIMPRIAYTLFEDFEVEVGMIVVEGPPPPANVTPHIGLATLYDTTDQVFVGLVYDI
ncbi:MAG: hypothetical protein ABW321_27190 [Polyangiales bacterium]